MPKISDLPAKSPATVEAMRDVCGVPALERLAQISVADYGAVGDGETDDTDAIRAARDAAEAANRVLFFPPCADAYMIRGGIRLHKNTRVSGHPLGKIRKFAAITTTLAEAVTLGQTVIPVADVSGFAVGQDVYIGPSATTTTYNGTRGEIVAVGTGTITIDAYNSASGGMRVAYSDPEGILVSSTFPMIYTDVVVTPDVVISPEIVGVHLDGNKQDGEPNAYACSLIHLDKLHTEGALLARNILRNSAADGLSDQGSGNSIIAFNRLYDNAGHGIHIGTTSSGQQILHNYVSGSGVDGVYYCNANRNTVTVGNFIENCPVAFAEIDSSEGDTVLAGNITKGCGVDYQVFGATGIVNIVGMVSIGNTSRVVEADSTKFVRVQGSARGGTKIGVNLTRVGGGSVDVDFTDWTGNYCVQVGNINALRSKKVRVSGSFNGGLTTRPILVQSSDDVLINDFVFDCGHAHDIVIAAASGQDAPSGVVIGTGIRNGTVSDGGINTIGAY